MSIALDRGGICGGYMREGISPPCMAVFESPEIVGAGDRRVVEVGKEEREEAPGLDPCSSSSSSSIGKNSDRSEVSSDAGDDSCEGEVQSSFKGPLDALDALEEVLPMRRGISRFYNGKSKSFASLADASSSPSIKEIAKPDNAYSRKRRNLIAYAQGWGDKNRSFPLRSNSGGISKRPLHTSRSTLALAVAMSNSSSSSSSESSSNSNSNSSSRLSPTPLPPLHPNTRPQATTWRSFSLADLRECGGVGDNSEFQKSK